MKVPSSVPLKMTRALSCTVPRSSRQLVAPSGMTGRGKEIDSAPCRRTSSPRRRQIGPRAERRVASPAAAVSDRRRGSRASSCRAPSPARQRSRCTARARRSPRGRRSARCATRSPGTGDRPRSRSPSRGCGPCRSARASRRTRRPSARSWRAAPSRPRSWPLVLTMKYVYAVALATTHELEPISRRGLVPRARGGEQRAEVVADEHGAAADGGALHLAPSADGRNRSAPTMRAEPRATSREIVQAGDVGREARDRRRSSRRRARGGRDAPSSRAGCTASRARARCDSACRRP